MIKGAANTRSVPVNIVGSSVFGRYPKISIEQTYNMIISDGWLVPYPGYKKIIELEDDAVGRGLFSSTRLKGMIAVIDQNVYLIDSNLVARRIGDLDTFNGDVFIAENNGNQIAICDKKDLYIYNYVTDNFSPVILDFTPVYVTFHNGYFIAAEGGEPKWRLSDLNDGTGWPADPENVGEFETKADNVLAITPIPGGGNQIFVIGRNVIEPWTNIGSGAQLFPYQRSSSFNIDYGCINSNTIAFGGDFVIWLGGNEKSGVAIMYSNGGETRQISTDGITFKLEALTNYANAYGYLAKIDGHLIYHITFPDDNLTLAYDFNTQRFFNLSDEYTAHHIAKKIAYFNNKYYFVSFIDGNLYELSSEYTEYDGAEIPRIRIPKTYRQPDSKPFVVDNLGFIIEQGEDSQVARVDMSISRNGGVTFGNIVGMNQNRLGVRQNKWIQYNLGAANEFTVQFRFWGHGRFVAYDGTMEAHA